ncbi:MAG: pyridoxamine 5'-phosphate oxidase family protein [Acidimicrobiales bacterium]
MSSAIKRILLPLGPDGEEPALLRSATVFSSWFDAPLQIACDDKDALARYQVLAGSLGVAIEPVLYLDDVHGEGMVAYANGNGPSIIVTEPSDDGRALAAASGQPVFLVADSTRQRMPVGPLVVELTGAADDMDALALAAILGRTLGETVRLVIGSDGGAEPPTTEQIHDAEARLRRMGCELGVDRIEPAELPALVVAGKTRGATAMILPARRLSERGLLDAAMAEGVNVFIAPDNDPDAGRPAPFAADLSAPIDRPPTGAKVEILDRAECLDRLARHAVARIGYIDAGWPVVVPVNYRLHNGDVFIRSLAGGKVRAAERGDVVCLELDGYDEGLRTGWSVVAHGALEVIGDPAVLNEAWANDPQPWIESESWQWLRMVPISITGRDVAPGIVD